MNDVAGKPLSPGPREPRTAAFRWPTVLLALLVVVAFAAPARGQEDADLPGRVGRIADFAGQLFLSPYDRATEWSPVGINYPVTSGDNLWVSGDGRAEIDYGGGQFRLAGDTSLNVARLDERQLALFVAQGRLIVRVRVLEAGDAARVDTPNTQVTLARPGLYRIDVAPDRQATVVTVREGEALVALTSALQQVLPGQAATVTGAEPAYADFRSGYGIDGFDSWSADRDRRYERSGTLAYVSRQMVGYAELDEYGYWENSATYGPVWYPTAVAADWAPYRYGYWTTAGGWGLTWVDAAPWGYAPSHYGRWVRVGPRWGWCPGTYVARPYWAPALVGWVGGGSWGLSLGSGGPVYGWVPLGWGEVYQPWWRRCSHNCWGHYNRPYAVNVNTRPHGPPARYANAGVGGGVTAAAASALGSRRPIAQNMVPVPGSLATSAPVLASAPPAATRSSQAPGLRPGERGTPPPASSLHPGSWPGRSTRVPGERPTGAVGQLPPSAESPPSPSGQAPGRRDGAPSQGMPATGGALSPTPVPESRRGAPAAPTPPAGGTVVATPPSRTEAVPSAPGPRPALSGAIAPALPQAVTPPPRSTGSGLPSAVGPGTAQPSRPAPPATDARRSAPPVLTPQPGETVVAPPPARAGAPAAPVARSSGSSGVIAPAMPSPSAVPSGRGGAGAAGPSAGAPTGGSPGVGGVPLPPQRSVPAPSSAPCQAPVPSGAPPASAPAPAQGTAAPVPQGRPAEAGTRGGRAPESGAQAGGTAQK